MATPHPVDEGAADELEKLGAPKSVVQEAIRNQVIEVLPLNWPIFLWFRAVADLMRYRQHDGQCLGLDLVQVQSEAALSDRDYTKTDFDGLRLMGLTFAQTVNKAK